jgi:hypothetical protein
MRRGKRRAAQDEGARMTMLRPISGRPFIKAVAETDGIRHSERLNLDLLSPRHVPNDACISGTSSLRLWHSRLHVRRQQHTCVDQLQQSSNLVKWLPWIQGSDNPRTHERKIPHETLLSQIKDPLEVGELGRQTSLRLTRDTLSAIGLAAPDRQGCEGARRLVIK